MAKLPVNRLINVTVNLSQLPAQAQSLSDLLVLGNSDVIDTTERMRTYSSLTSIATDFGTSAPEYLAAAAWFGQSPQPTRLRLGRWAQTATKGRLTGGVLSAAQQLIGAWTAVVSGGFKITIDGGSEQSVTGINFSAVSNLNAVAALIDTAIAGATFTWDAVNQRFVVLSATTGATSTVTFMTAAASGTDISTMLNMRSTSSGAYRTDGIAAESAAAAAAIFDDRFSQQWYALVMPTINTNSDHTAVAAFIEATTTKHIYGVTTQEAGVLSAVDTTNVAYLLQQLGYKRTLTQYSSSSAYAVCSLLGRILTTNYNANLSVITLMYKVEPGVVAETLSETQANAVQGFNCNVFVEYDNDTAIIQYGVMANGFFIDEITNTDWFAVTSMTAVYNVLYTSKTKIPQTDAGMQILGSAVGGVCTQGVNNGIIAPGQWNSDGFGPLQTGDYLETGFFIYIAPVATQSPSDRAARKSMPIQVAAKLAGAVHTVDVILNFDR